MITTDTAGGALSAAYTTRIAASFLDPTRSPEDVILFCRKVSGTWYTRDVSKLWIGMSDIEKQLGAQYGVSEGTETSFNFTNAPRTTLSSAYASGTTLNVYDYPYGYIDRYFELEADDWIAISDYDHTEYRRVSSFTGDTIVITEALDYTYAKDDTEIRFLFALEPNVDRLDPDDFYNGWILVKAGFADMSEWIWTFQGKITRGQVTPDDTVTITCRDRVKELVEYEFGGRIEFDDRGVCSVPSPHSSNQGTGTISDVTYNSGKLPDVLTSETWDFTYIAGDQFQIDGSVSGTIDTVSASGTAPQRTWSADQLSAYGWQVEISEGDVPFAIGDQFRFWSEASGNIAVIDGDGTFPTADPIDTTGLSSLYPSSIVEYVIKTLLGWTHENPETAASTDLIDSTLLSTVQARAQDYFCELRGKFNEGTRAIEIIDDALRPVLGWLYSTEDDHLGIQLYSPFMLNSPTSFNLSHDVDNGSRSLNVLSVASQPIDVETVRNRVVFQYNTSDVQEEYTWEDTDSQTAYGSRTLVIRAEDYADYALSTRFHISQRIAKAAAHRIGRRYKDPLQTFALELHPNALLLELGDTPMLYSRDVQVSNQRIWITTLRKNLFTRVVSVDAELGTHINGKFAKVVGAADPAIAARWDSTGFIGSEGEERLGICGHATLGLDVVGNNDGSYDAKLGTPDQWGNYVEDNYIVW